MLGRGQQEGFNYTFHQFPEQVIQEQTTDPRESETLLDIGQALDTHTGECLKEVFSLCLGCVYQKEYVPEGLCTRRTVYQKESAALESSRRCPGRAPGRKSQEQRLKEAFFDFVPEQMFNI